MSFFSTQNSAFLWGSSIYHNSKGQDCRSLDFFKDSERFFTVAGVYDGHGLADFASMYSSEYLPTLLAKNTSSTLKQSHVEKDKRFIVANALTNTILSADLKYMEIDPPTNSSRSGSTICMCLEMANEIYFVNVGDSRAIVGGLPKYDSTPNINADNHNLRIPRLHVQNSTDRNYICMNLIDTATNGSNYEGVTIDHCASENASEIARCRLAGATISQNRLFPETCLHWWSFMLTRTFGNTFSKGKAMIVNPDIYHKPLTYIGHERNILYDTIDVLVNGKNPAGSVEDDDFGRASSSTGAPLDGSAQNSSRSGTGSARYSGGPDSNSNPGLPRVQDLKNPRQIKGHSMFYDLSGGTIDEFLVDPVDYILMASDGVWAVLSNREVHAIISDSVSQYRLTKNPDFINPCLVSSTISKIIMEKVKREDLYADDISIVLGFRKQALWPRDVDCASDEQEALRTLDAWYAEIQAGFKNYYKSIAMRGGSTYDNVIKLLYTNNTLSDGNMQNRFRFLFDIDKVLKEVHLKYKSLKAGDLAK